MITSTMNAQEISRMVDKDRDRIRKYLSYRYKEMERNMRKGFSNRASKIIDYSTPNNKYKIVLYVTGKFHTFSLLALNYESNEWLDVTFSLNETEARSQYIATSVHFFNRYAERFLGADDMTLNEIILKYYQSMPTSIVLYCDENRIVYASSNGLSLATYDEDKEIIHIVTYVSAEMLKYSQFSSWVKVWGVCDRMNQLFRREIDMNGAISPETIQYWGFTENEKLTIEEASEIYSKFFKNKTNDTDKRIQIQY